MDSYGGRERERERVKMWGFEPVFIVSYQEGDIVKKRGEI